MPELTTIPKKNATNRNVFSFRQRFGQTALGRKYCRQPVRLAARISKYLKFHEIPWEIIVSLSKPDPRSGKCRITREAWKTFQERNLNHGNARNYEIIPETAVLLLWSTNTQARRFLERLHITKLARWTEINSGSQKKQMKTVGISSKWTLCVCHKDLPYTNLDWSCTTYSWR
jgi:hypothetical protein